MPVRWNALAGFRTNLRSFSRTMPGLMRRKRYDGMSGDGLLFAQALRELLKIKADCGQQSGSGGSHFLHDRINPRNL